MITNDLMISIVSLSIFTLGTLSRRFGTAALSVMVVLVIDICFFKVDNPFPYGCVISIGAFVTLIVLHGKYCGKRSPIYQYNPYNPHSRLPIRIRLFLLVLGVITALITALVLLNFKLEGK